MLRCFIPRLLLLFVLIVTALLGHYLLLGRAPVVQLAPAASLAGVVSQSLSTGQGGTSLPAVNQDFTIKSVRYFDDKVWAVVFVQPTSHSSLNPSLLVLESQGGAYQAVLGPGSAFEESYLLSLPGAVGQYLKSRGAIYESAD